MPPTPVTVLATALLAGSFDASLVAQAQPTWTHVSPGSGPSARYYHAMAYDSQRATAVLFGGRRNSSPNPQLGDTWEWNGDLWTQVHAAAPPARYSHAMTYDNQRGVTVLFGGRDTNFHLLGDTWEWDGVVWTQAATTGPPARDSHAMAYDRQRGVTVLFGGIQSGSYLGDTWEWDGNQWSLVASSGPSMRFSPVMAYDEQRSLTVLFGGYDSNNRGDTWEWDGSSWTQRSATGPVPRCCSAMVYDSQRGITVLFGGSDSNHLVSSYLGDTWEWDGNSWTLAIWSGPAPRASHAMVYDSQRGHAVLFGGYNSFYLGDTWTFSTQTQSLASAFGTGCGSPSLDLQPVSLAPPTIGTSAQLSLSNVPSPPSLAFLSLGWSNTSAGGTPLPLPLDSYGLTGCFLLQSADAPANPVQSTGAGNATYGLALPNWTGLLGTPLYLQGWASAPSFNPAGVIVSNGVEWVIGNT